jgi:Squalene-hopene cyclase C-terminal domain
LNDAAKRAMKRGVEYILAAQHAAGNWTDFWVSPGTSDAWVTAYAGLALHAAAQHGVAGCVEALDRAVAWLQRHRHERGGWGYNGTVAIDADSTAHAISLLARFNLQVPVDAISALGRHRVAGRGFRTYAFEDADHEWTRPAADITGAALRALFDAGEYERETLRCEFAELLKPAQQRDGFWHGYWWPAPAYTTALVLEVWREAGCPPLAYPIPALPAGVGAFEAACWLCAAAHLARPLEANQAASRLLKMQHCDGGWPGDAELHLPPSHPHRQSWQPISTSRDARRIFTTSTAVRALAASMRVSHEVASVSVCGAQQPRRRSQAGTACDAIIAEVAEKCGFNDVSRGQIVATFRALTHESLDERTAWPSAQLSSLSGGIPLEFSAAVLHGEITPQLRYTVEPGEVQAPPEQRAQSGLRVIARVARQLGYDEGWSRVQSMLDGLTAPIAASAEWQRFTVWAGIDHDWSDTDQNIRTVLKAYVHLVPESTSYFPDVISQAGMCVSDSARTVFDLLKGNGFAQEIGVGVAPGNKVGTKVYFELGGWHRLLVKKLLVALRFAGSEDDLCPAIPGLLKESLAQHTRAGLALRLDPHSGDVVALTAAIQLTQGMLPPRVIAERVNTWIEARNANAAPHRALFQALAVSGDLDDRIAGPRHTLFTRSLSRDGRSWATFYIRPGLSCW